MTAAITIDPDSLDFRGDHPNRCYLLAPRAFPAHGKRLAIKAGEELLLDFEREPEPGDLVLLDREFALGTYRVGVPRRNVAAVVVLR